MVTTWMEELCSAAYENRQKLRFDKAGKKKKKVVNQLAEELNKKKR